MGNLALHLYSFRRIVLKRKSVRAALGLLVSLALVTPATTAQDVSSLALLSKLPPDELSSTIVSIQFQGPGREPLGPLLITVNSETVDWKRLRAIPGLQIGDWEQRRTVPSFTVTVEDMRGLLGAVRDTALAAPAARRQTDAWLSLAVVAGRGRESKTFRGTVSREKSQEFFVLMRGALRADPKDISIMNGAANYPAMNALQSYGCALGLLPAEIPAKDVSASVAIARSGLRFSPEHRFECTVTVTNTSNQAIRAPISVVVDLSSNISLANAHGRTCVTTPVGREFVTIPIPSELFKPGQSLETLLVFAGSEGEDIHFSTKVLATPGER